MKESQMRMVAGEVHVWPVLKRCRRHRIMIVGHDHWAEMTLGQMKKLGEKLIEIAKEKPKNG